MVQYIGNDRYEVQIGAINGEYDKADLEELFIELRNELENHTIQAIREDAFTEGHDEGYGIGYDEADANAKAYDQWEFDEERVRGYENGYDTGFQNALTACVHKLSNITVQ